MSDFDVPYDSEWNKRFREKNGSYEGDVLAVSPTALRMINNLRLEQQLATSGSPEFLSRAMDNLQETIVEERVSELVSG